MNDRVRLIDSRTNGSYMHISDNIRGELTTEFKALNHATMDLFIQIAMEQFKNITMYPVITYHSINNFKQHTAIESNDIQIFYSGHNSVVGHALCIQYHAYSQMVRVYDSTMCRLNPIHKEMPNCILITGASNTKIQNHYKVNRKYVPCLQYMYATIVVIGKRSCRTKC